jgi:hypothetical protein
MIIMGVANSVNGGDIYPFTSKLVKLSGELAFASVSSPWLTFYRRLKYNAFIVDVLDPHAPG